MLFNSINNPASQDAGSTKLITPKFNTVEISISTLVEKLRNVDSLSDNDIRNIIYRQYGTILNYDLFLSCTESREVAQQLFTNEKFLSNLVFCVPDINLNEHQIICCNKLAYDYIALHSINECNQTIRNLLMELSMRVNLKTVLALSAIIGTDNAKYLAMLRRSSFKDNKNVYRVNKFIIKSGLELLEPDIINIYGKLFDRVSTLFTVTMFCLPDPDYTKLELLRYDEMSKAMIDILDSMPSREIKKVLSGYVNSYQLQGEPNVRFSMKNIHESYYRIKAVINELSDEGIIVP